MKIHTILCGLCLFSASVQAEGNPPPANNANAPQTETIQVADRFGTMQEERVPAMRSELRYIPSGQENGYALIGSDESQSESQNAHQDDEMLIPSWNLFSW